MRKNDVPIEKKDKKEAKPRETGVTVEEKGYTVRKCGVSVTEASKSRKTIIVVEMDDFAARKGDVSMEEESGLAVNGKAVT